MSVVNTIDRVTDWARESICSKIKLKVPPEDDSAPTDASFDYKTITPAAFGMYVPTRDKLPPDILSPIPSVCVRFREGADDLSNSRGSIVIELCFSTWNPGTHGTDIMQPVSGERMTVNRWTGSEANAYFRRYGEGWRDVWNMVDIALQELESTTDIDGILIDRSVPVKFGPLAEQESIPDFYPFWYAWVSFGLSYPIVRSIRGVDELL